MESCRESAAVDLFGDLHVKGPLSAATWRQLGRRVASISQSKVRLSDTVQEVATRRHERRAPHPLGIRNVEEAASEYGLKVNASEVADRCVPKDKPQLRFRRGKIIHVEKFRHAWPRLGCLRKGCVVRYAAPRPSGLLEIHVGFQDWDALEFDQLSEVTLAEDLSLCVTVDPSSEEFSLKVVRPTIVGCRPAGILSPIATLLMPIERNGDSPSASSKMVTRSDDEPPLCVSIEEALSLKKPGLLTHGGLLAIRSAVQTARSKGLRPVSEIAEQLQLRPQKSPFWTMIGAAGLLGATEEINEVLYGRVPTAEEIFLHPPARKWLFDDEQLRFLTKLLQESADLPSKFRLSSFA